MEKEEDTRLDDEERPKKLNDDVVVFMRKRSDTEAPRYTARLKKYTDLQKKRRRAAHAHGARDRRASATRKKAETEQKDTAPENTEHPGNEDERMSKRRGGEPKCMHHGSRSFSRSRSNAPSDKCCRRRRRRRRSRSRRRRRRSCRRRRRRRRSRSRRRRRRSCRKRRRRRRRRRRRC